MRIASKVAQGNQAAREDDRKGHQGPIFPYRFSFETSLIRRHASQIEGWDVFCRWSIGGYNRPRALEWCDHGKGKGVTALPSDEPLRCCSDCTPLVVLRKKVDELTRVLAPGTVYTGTIAGHGWYSSPPGTEFLIRMVTNPDDVELLRAEAAVYELYETTWAKSEMFKLKNMIPPLEFHGFFQSGSGNAAAIVLRASNMKLKRYA